MHILEVPASRSLWVWPYLDDEVKVRLSEWALTPQDYVLTNQRSLDIESDTHTGAKPCGHEGRDGDGASTCQVMLKIGRTPREEGAGTQSQPPEGPALLTMVSDFWPLELQGSRLHLLNPQSVVVPVAIAMQHRHTLSEVPAKEFMQKTPWQLISRHWQNTALLLGASLPYTEHPHFSQNVLAVHGTCLFYMEHPCSTRNILALHEAGFYMDHPWATWSILALHGPSWLYMDHPCSTHNILALYEACSTWTNLALHRASLSSVENPCSSWSILVLHERCLFYMEHSCSTWSILTLQGSIPWRPIMIPSVLSQNSYFDHLNFRETTVMQGLTSEPLRVLEMVRPENMMGWDRSSGPVVSRDSHLCVVMGCV